MSVLALIVVLGILVFIHEGGHFLAARAVGAPVSVFSIGFGKRLLGFERRGTDYRLSLIPLGGYVRIHGLGPDESDAVGSDHQEHRLLPRGQRAAILVAGPAANVLGAIAFIAVAFMAGMQVPAWQDEPPVVAWIDPRSPAAETELAAGDRVLAVDGRAIATWRELETATLGAAGRALTLRFARDGREQEVTLTPRAVTRYQLGYAGLAPPIPAEVPGVLAGSAAEHAGLRPGDRITAVDGEPIRHFYDLMRVVSVAGGRELVLEVQRDGQTLSLPATPRGPEGEAKLGIPVPNPTVLRRLGPLAALGEAGRECWRMTRETLQVIGRMVTGTTSLGQVSGPIVIAQVSGEAARSGIVPMIWLLGVISLQLAIFNLLPIPMLDGGHLAVIGFEAARRRDLAWRTKERILTVGFWLLMGLIVFVLYNDLLKVLPPGLERLIPFRGQ